MSKLGQVLYDSTGEGRKTSPEPERPASSGVTPENWSLPDCRYHHTACADARRSPTQTKLARRYWAHDSEEILESKLIYDVGMHKGEDSRFYLSRGYRVVGVEANPKLAALLKEAFAKEIKSNKLQLVEKAIAPTEGVVRFGIDRNLSIWGSVSTEFLERNARNGSTVDYIDVQATTFSAILREYGMPYYLKIDIEGMDMQCILALHQFKERPRYISIESSVTSGVADLTQCVGELAHLWVLGYRHFKYVDQAAVHRGDLNGKQLDLEGKPVCYNDWGGSGPFGEETPGRWLTIAQALSRAKRYVAYQNTLGFGGRYSHHLPLRIMRRLRKYALRLPSHSWYDLHARLGT